MLPAIDSGEYAFGIDGADEGLGIGVGLCEEAVGDLQIGDGPSLRRRG